MGLILYSLNVNFVVQLHNGFAGAILISVNLAIKNSVMDNMLVNIQNNNYLNA
jgi:hypothetical protein